MQIEIRQTDVFAAWFTGLRDRQARARVTVRIRRLSLGNPGDVRPVGEGVSEMRIDYGPGYGCISSGAATPAVTALSCCFVAATNVLRIAI